MDRPYPGLGLGLSITQRLVNLHGSVLGLKSRPGGGTIFFFQLQPAKNFSAEPAPVAVSRRYIEDSAEFLRAVTPNREAPGQTLAVDGKQARCILIVDDEPINQQLVCNHLSAEGFQVRVVGNGLVALEMVAAETPDLLLLDIMMPQLNGFEVCRKLRETYELYELPIILLTVRNRLTDLVQGLQSGANDYLTKPFFKEELLSRINTLLEAKSAVERLKQNQRLLEEIQRRKTAEEELRASQRRLARILDSAEDAILAVDALGLVRFFNQGAEKLFGCSLNEALNQHLEMLFDDDFLAEFNTIVGAGRNQSSP